MPSVNSTHLLGILKSADDAALINFKDLDFGLPKPEGLAPLPKLPQQHLGPSVPDSFMNSAGGLLHRFGDVVQGMPSTEFGKGVSNFMSGAGEWMDGLTPGQKAALLMAVGVGGYAMG